MSKIVLWSLAVILLSSLGGSGYYFFSRETHTPIEANNCVFEVKTCPDGTHVTRIGKNCDFAICPDGVEVIPASTSSDTVQNDINVTKGEPVSVSKTSSEPKLPTDQPPTPQSTPQQASLFSSIVSALVTAYNQTSAITQNAVTSVVSTVTTIGAGNGNSNNTSTPTNLADTKYFVVDGNIVTSDNTIIYSIPANVIESLGTTTDGWTNTPINVVPLGETAPILNAIPIENLPGKYYLSENSFGNIENCEFSNKIYIFDSNTNDAVLLYEENSETLSHDDPRACNSEIILLATENNNLILKYHTLNTGTLCDSSWSEPDRTWYLDVANLQSGMHRYYIPSDLRTSAEQKEEDCRANLEAQ